MIWKGNNLFSSLYWRTFKKKAFTVAGKNPKTELEYLKDYDIFATVSEIYKVICYPITFFRNASDNIFITDSFKKYIFEAKKKIFPGNTQLCHKNYLGFDNDTVSAICEFEFTNYNLVVITKYTTLNDYKSFTFDEEEFNDTKKDNYFTMEVFKCIKLPFTSIGFKNNYGSYLMLVMHNFFIISL